MAASIASVAVMVSHPLGVPVDVSIAFPALVASFVFDRFRVRIVANAAAVTVSIAVAGAVSIALAITVSITVMNLILMNIVVTIVTIMVATVVTAIVTAIMPVSTTCMVLMYYVVLRVKSKEEELGHRRDVLGGDVSKFVFET